VGGSFSIKPPPVFLALRKPLCGVSRLSFDNGGLRIQPRFLVLPEFSGRTSVHRAPNVHRHLVSRATLRNLLAEAANQ
jgi:hypothetical protein